MSTGYQIKDRTGIVESTEEYVYPSKQKMENILKKIAKSYKNNTR